MSEKWGSVYPPNGNFNRDNDEHPSDFVVIIIFSNIFRLRKHMLWCDVTRCDICVYMQLLGRLAGARRLPMVMPDLYVSVQSLPIALHNNIYVNFSVSKGVGVFGVVNIWLRCRKMV